MVRANLGGRHKGQYIRTGGYPRREQLDMVISTDSGKTTRNHIERTLDILYTSTLLSLISFRSCERRCVVSTVPISTMYRGRDAENSLEGWRGLSDRRDFQGMRMGWEKSMGDADNTEDDIRSPGGEEGLCTRHEAESPNRRGRKVDDNT